MFLSIEDRVFRVEYVFREGNTYTDLVVAGAAKSAVYDRARAESVYE
jgi:hypothetical protein